MVTRLQIGLLGFDSQ